MEEERGAREERKELLLCPSCELAFDFCAICAICGGRPCLCVAAFVICKVPGMWYYLSLFRHFVESATPMPVHTQKPLESIVGCFRLIIHGWRAVESARGIA